MTEVIKGLEKWNHELVAETNRLKELIKLKQDNRTTITIDEHNANVELNNRIDQLVREINRLTQENNRVIQDNASLLQQL